MEERQRATFVECYHLLRSIGYFEGVVLRVRGNVEKRAQEAVRGYFVLVKTGNESVWYRGRGWRNRMQRL